MIIVMTTRDVMEHANIRIRRMRISCAKSIGIRMRMRICCAIKITSYYSYCHSTVLNELVLNN